MCTIVIIFIICLLLFCFYLQEIVSDAQFIVDGALYVDLEQGTLGEYIKMHPENYTPPLLVVSV